MNKFKDGQVVSFKNIGNPMFWFINAGDLLKVAENFYVWDVDFSFICNRVHVSITQYLELYIMLLGESIVITFDNRLMETLERCMKHDKGLKRIYNDCQTIAPYLDEINYPGGIEGTKEIADNAIIIGRRIEKHLRPKIKNLLKKQGLDTADKERRAILTHLNKICDEFKKLNATMKKYEDSYVSDCLNEYVKQGSMSIYASQRVVEKDIRKEHDYYSYS